MKSSLIYYPDLNSLEDFQKKYIRLIPQGMHLFEALDESKKQLNKVLETLTEEQSGYRYQPDKWSIKTMVLHISDTERVFQYRMLSVARRSGEHLLPFDENLFATHSNADARTFKSILNEWENVSSGLHILLEGLTEAALQLTGTVNNRSTSPAIMGFFASGHRLHHLQVLKERYLLG